MSACCRTSAWTAAGRKSGTDRGGHGARPDPTAHRQSILGATVNRKVREARILRRAREIASSGRHIGWYYVASELHFQMGEPLAFEIIDNPQVRDELDRICAAAR